MSNLISNIRTTYKSYMKVGLLAMVISAILFAFFGLLIWNFQIPENMGRPIVKVCSIIMAIMVIMETIYIKTGWPKRFLSQGRPRKFTFYNFLNMAVVVLWIYSAFFSK